MLNQSSNPILGFNNAEIAERGRTVYRERIQQLVEAEHHGKFLVMDIDTSEYEMDTDEDAALDRMEVRNRNGRLYLLRIGYPASLFIGSRMS